MTITPPNDPKTPLVSVCMLAYNVAPYIGQAIEGVLHQKTGFRIELVIGEDCSKDDTRAICETYAARYPDIIRLLPAPANLGIAGNAARTLQECRGLYIAICDGDDVWQDSGKLQQQVQFLQQHPDYGVVYTDVAVIDEHGHPTDDAEHAQLRQSYAGGHIFFKLLQGNFINNSTALFQRALLNGHNIDTDRNYYTHDHLMWLHLATLSKIHFMDSQTTLYRKHSGGVTNSAVKLEHNRRKFLQHLPAIILKFDRQNAMPLAAEGRLFLFRKMLSVLYRNEGSAAEKRRILLLLPKYFPGLPQLATLVIQKIRQKLAPAGHHTITTHQ